MTETSQWYELYRSAMLELDPMALKNKIERAGAAMRQRSEELKHDASGEEQRALADALKNLGSLECLELKPARVATFQDARGTL